MYNDLKWGSFNLNVNALYKEETYLANIILRDIFKNCKLWIVFKHFLFGFWNGYCVMTSCFVTTFEIQNNDLSYHDQ